ncbi:hypothetical protein Taro_037181 [Colocasia esculenta]|uniref:Uncharacterized protein n=1 Tax=Colocasia esculenta TaxID=4460 RepID=A0A843WC15_COLES|nr:hypothetical protein [Colocasia esculenta]
MTAAQCGAQGSSPLFGQFWATRSPFFLSFQHWGCLGCASGPVQGSSVSGPAWVGSDRTDGAV